jgi:hypothetical protein
MMRAFVLLAACALAWPAAALGHEGGKAEPRIAAGVSGGAGTVRTLTVRLTDVDSGRVISGATVTAYAEMANPHVMRTVPWSLVENEAGTYQAAVQFPMAANWSVAVSVEGDAVVRARSSLSVRIARRAVPEAGTSVTPLPTRLEETITDRDLLAMAALWAHGVAALGWILGVVVMAFALSTPAGVLANGLRTRLRTSYRRWGAWVHWSLVVAIVVTGVYNMLYVTPFSLAWRPSEAGQLADVPYGALYEAILIIKLGLFAALLITGTHVLLRTIRPEGPTAPANPHPPGFIGTLVTSLGPAGLVYLACVPLILAAAMALRYVHILSHVADVLQS